MHVSGEESTTHRPLELDASWFDLLASQQMIGLLGLPTTIIHQYKCVCVCVFA